MVVDDIDRFGLGSTYRDAGPAQNAGEIPYNELAIEPADQQAPKIFSPSQFSPLKKCPIFADYQQFRC
jgi:hypothetical protein